MPIVLVEGYKIHKIFLTTYYIYMMNWYRITSLMSFYYRAVTKFNVQSPFLFDFVSNVLDTDKCYYVFEKIESQRQKLLLMKNVVNINDFGAGSRIHHSNRKKISEIAKTSISSKSKCRILFNLIMQHKLNSIIELGTSLGISSSYMASTSNKANLITLEGDKTIASIAKRVHEELGLKNISIKIGKFSETLKSSLDSFSSIDMAFIDGHHQQKPTLEYFDMIASKCHNDSVIVIDDIRWSQEMNVAWNTIIHKPEVTLSIDLYDIGIIFLKKELSKEKITYIPYHLKPWRIGLFG